MYLSHPTQHPIKTAVHHHGHNWATFQGDCGQIGVDCSPDGFSWDLLLTSTPFPGQRGYDKSPRQYFMDLNYWIGAALKFGNHKSVIIQEVMFKRDDDGFFGARVLEIPRFYRRSWGMGLVNCYVWDKMNATPSGPVKTQDYQTWSLVYVFAFEPNVRQRPWYKDYHYKTVGKVQAVEDDKRQTRMPWAPENKTARKADVVGNLAGGHEELNTEGAIAGNIIHMSNSADEKKVADRAPGGSFRRGFATRLIHQYSNKGDVVLDIMGGRMTVGIDAIDLGRKFVGIEIDPTPYQNGAEWLAQFEKEQMEKTHVSST